jgi:hypothetical protein
MFAGNAGAYLELSPLGDFNTSGRLLLKFRHGNHYSRKSLIVQAPGLISLFL